MKKSQKIELKIYNALGVNWFRKRILPIYNKIPKYDYKIRDSSDEALQYFKKISKERGIIHGIGLGIVVTVTATSLILVPGIPLSAFSIWWLIGVADLYSVMTQRQHCIRINEILRKRALKKKRKKENNETIDNNSKDFTFTKGQTLKITNESDKENELPLWSEEETIQKQMERLEQLRKDIIALDTPNIEENSQLFGQQHKGF